MAEVCLVGLFRREYRKLASAIPAGIEAREASGELSETVAQGSQEGEQAFIETCLCYWGGA
jgi:hypothetical protein